MMAIRTPDYHLRVFISSTLKELSEERKAVRQAILKLRLTPVMFESGARPHPAQELYQSYLAQSHIFIGIYWQSYGWIAPEMKISGLEDEYSLSTGLPRLIYIKNPAPERQPELSNLLDRIREDNTSSYTYFSTPSQLKELVQNDLALLLSERFEGRNKSEQAPSLPPSPTRTNVPIPRNSLIDRQVELKTACDLLRDDNTALVTLTGAGGTGKSRIAIQIGIEILDSFPDGVHLVKLEAVSNPMLVLPTIAELFSLRETTDSRPISEILREFLRDKHMLLILDNFEQVIDAGPSVAELLEACPKLKCLITSRAPLRLRAEKELPIPPLSYPSTLKTNAVDNLSQYSAVELFIQRSQAVKPDFTVTNLNAPAVAEICSRLDGLPLAIELAAARSKLFTPENMLTRIEHRFDFLTSGKRDLPVRQRTLRSAIDWSYNLLNERECMLFRRMAVFNGGCSLEAVETVCNIDGDMTMCLDDLLESLIANNLVIQLETSDGEPRFGMLSTIHDYALERLVEFGEIDTIHYQHAAFYHAFVTAVEPRVRSAEREQWQHAMTQEMGNIREALGWACKTGKCIELADNIYITLGIFWHLCGYISEGNDWGKKLLTLCDDSTPIATRAGLLCFNGLFYRAKSDQLSAMELVDKSIELCQNLDDKKLYGNALMIRGMIASAMRDLTTASFMFERSIENFKIAHELWNEAIALSWLGDIALYQNDPERATALHHESVRLGRLQGDPWCLMPALMTSTEIDILNGDLGPAYKKATEIIEVLRKSGDRWSLSWTLLDLSHVLYFQGDLERATDCSLEALSLANTFGNLGAIIVAMAQVSAMVARQAQSTDSQEGKILAAQLCGATVPFTQTPGIFTWMNTQKLYDDAVSEASSFTGKELWEREYLGGQNIPLDKAIQLANQALKK